MVNDVTLYIEWSLSTLSQFLMQEPIKWFTVTYIMLCVLKIFFTILDFKSRKE